MDFTFEIYKSLITELHNRKYTFTSFGDYISSSDDNPGNKLILLRHDVDLLPQNSLQMARIEAELGVRGTYFFRIVPESFDVSVIEKIAKLGHEIGYHYEDVDLVRGDRSKVIGDSAPLTNNHQPLTGLIDRAMESFLKNLETIRKIADIKTICMHGSPMSPYDNRLLWTKYDYRDYGIIGEPYFDLDFSRVGYYTDTGRRWDGDRVSVRDKISSSKFQVPSSKQLVSNIELADNPSNIKNIEPETRNMEPGTKNNFPRFRKTTEIIAAIENGSFSEKAMITIHPQRWHDRAMPWMRELVLQNIKNLVKRIVVKRNVRRNGEHE